jgi:hypothetical protein
MVKGRGKKGENGVTFITSQINGIKKDENWYLDISWGGKFTNTI